MAQLTIISETGMFHSACRCTWGDVVEWYGFKPQTNMAPAGKGMVDRKDRTASINHTISFTVEGALLRAAVEHVAQKYADKTYVVTVVDCVSFTADVARRCGLRVPRVNFTPYGLILTLALWNSYESMT